MFNLLVQGRGWIEGRDTMMLNRTLEYCDPSIVQRFRPNGELDLLSLVKLPCLFLDEGHGDEIAHVGSISRARITGTKIALEFAYDNTVPTIPNKFLVKLAAELEMDRFEFGHTHWAVKDVDLFRVLLRNMQPRRVRPRVFQLADPENIEPTLVSAMMPFDSKFDAVYAALKRVSEQVGLRCRRADDIWENPAVIHDVVLLIDRSRLVICDCTGRNPNVFYEAGIAHTLGREVILITQAESDVPFDLRHLRFIPYLNNGEGLAALSERLRSKLADLA